MQIIFGGIVCILGASYHLMPEEYRPVIALAATISGIYIIVSGILKD